MAIRGCKLICDVRFKMSKYFFISLFNFFLIHLFSLSDYTWYILQVIYWISLSLEAHSDSQVSHSSVNWSVSYLLYATGLFCLPDIERTTFLRTVPWISQLVCLKLVIVRLTRASLCWPLSRWTTQYLLENFLLTFF